MGEDVCVQCLGGHRLGVLDPKGRGQPLQNIYRTERDQTWEQEAGQAWYF